MPNYFKDRVKDIKGQALNDQVAYFKLAGAPLPKASLIKKAEEKRDALRAAIDEYVAGKWIPKVLVFDLGPGSEDDDDEVVDEDDIESSSDE